MAYTYARRPIGESKLMRRQSQSVRCISGFNAPITHRIIPRSTIIMLPRRLRTGEIFDASSYNKNHMYAESRREKAALTGAGGTAVQLCAIHTARQTRQDGPVCVVSGVAV